MQALGRMLLSFPFVVTPLASQAPVDWQAKEAAVYQAAVDVDPAAFAANLDSAYVGVYARGIVDRETQIAGIRGEWKSFDLSQFTVRAIDSAMVLVTYRLAVQGTNGGTFWASTLWRLRDGEWRMAVHTAAPAAADLPPN